MLIIDEFRTIKYLLLLEDRFSSIIYVFYHIPVQYGPYEDTWDCYRSDETDLTQQWLAQKEDAGETAAVVMNKSELDELNLDEVDSLMGFFGQDHMSLDHERVEERDPPLNELVEKAITVLKKKGNGFVLLVEAGRIDHAHHEVQVFLLLFLGHTGNV